ncbi:mavicyanin-like [Wolffia australiana]
MATTLQRRSSRRGRLLLLFNVLQLLALSTAAAALHFRIGGEKGWHKPSGSDSETYNEWARRNRFHIGDNLYFKYQNDSVRVVDYNSYSRCNTSGDGMTFADGNTTFVLDRHGFFFFISGNPAHCVAGQKLVIRVMAHDLSPAPSPFSAGGDGTNSPSSQPMHSGSSKPWIELFFLAIAISASAFLV